MSRIQQNLKLNVAVESSMEDGLDISLNIIQEMSWKFAE
jgi:hypothetical protein